MSTTSINKEVVYEGVKFLTEIHIDPDTSFTRRIVLRDVNGKFLNTLEFDSNTFHDSQYMRDYQKAIIATIEDYRENEDSSYRNDLFYEIENWDGHL
ncbi:hypothetical protein KLEB273_gp243 [Bacillus phage vB_BauM_KLEB27-3]|nr:hypothetical protein KLEB273_gp243 [Bacillus phage vB_BauM_KLEB27-3]